MSHKPEHHKIEQEPINPGKTYGSTISHPHKVEHDKREGRADETEPPIGTGEPEPPLAEPELPAERVMVYGDASATYGSMIAPEVIRPHAGKLDEILEPVRQEQEEKRAAEKKGEDEKPKTTEEIVHKVTEQDAEEQGPEPEEEDERDDRKSRRAKS